MEEEKQVPAEKEPYFPLLKNLAESGIGKETELNVQYAGLAVRLAAAVLDLVIITLPIVILELIILGPEFYAPRNKVNGEWISIIAQMFYFALMESSAKQGTFGKRIMNLKVTDLEGNRISFFKALCRYWAKILSLAFLCLGIIMVAFNDTKQGLHDLLVSTHVMET